VGREADPKWCTILYDLCPECKKKEAQRKAKVAVEKVVRGK